LISQTGEAREVHHFAALIGYGAACVHPYLALQTVADQVRAGRIRAAGITPIKAQKQFKTAIEEGLLKVMSKIGITTVASYMGAQAFEAIGLNPHVIDTCFAGTPSS